MIDRGPILSLTAEGIGGPCYGASKLKWLWLGTAKCIVYGVLVMSETDKVQSVVVLCIEGIAL